MFLPVNMLRTIESSLEYNQQTLSTFLDIESAFNNVSTNAITTALQAIRVSDPITQWIETMLNARIIHSEVE